MILLTADYRKFLSFSFVVLFFVLITDSGVSAKTKKYSFGRKAKSENSKSERIKSNISRTKRLIDNDPHEWDGRFVGRNPNGYDSPWAYPQNTPTSQIIPVNKTSGGETIWYINGIFTDIGGQYATMKLIAQQTKQQIIGIRNSTEAGLADVYQTKADIERRGNNEATTTLAKLLYQKLSVKNTTEEIHLLAHSQGTVIVRNAIESVKKSFEDEGKNFCEVLEKLSLIKAEIYGSPVFEFPTGPSYYHSCNYNDPVCDGTIVPQPGVRPRESREIRDRDAGVSKNAQYLSDCGLTIPSLLLPSFSSSRQAIIKSKMYGGNANVDNFDCRVTIKILSPTDNELLADHLINSLYLKRRAITGVSFPPPPSCFAKLFLFDTSGSMGEAGKWDGELKGALEALKNYEELTEAKTQFFPTTFLSFAGECSENSVNKLFEFDVDVAKISKQLPNILPKPSGGTPLYISFEVASKMLKDYLTANPYIEESSLYVCSDGEDKCEQGIQPDGSYSGYGKNSGKKSSLLANLPKNTKVYSIGYDLSAGSKGERDLQYMAFISGGKYYNAADPRQLKRALQKLSQSYFPKTIALSDSQMPKFRDTLNKAGIALQKKKADEALKFYRQLEADFKRDGINNPELYFNLAQSLEANDRYKGAVEYYQRYLQSNSQAADKALVEQKIAILKQDYKDQFEYYLKIIESDSTYLKKYYQDLFDKRNNDLAAEFAGFVTEKGEFYKNLQDILEIQDKEIKNHTKDLSDGLYDLSDRIDSPSFDRDAVSLLTIPISKLEEILELLNKNKSTFMLIK